MARSTIADVAKLAGVSQATVSRALRGADNVTERTRQKVEQAADQLNFTLSKNASSLASGKTMRVILLSSGKLNDWFDANVLEGVYEVLDPEGYDVSPAVILGKEEADAYFAQLPKNRNADAIIVSSFQLDGTLQQQLKGIDMPSVGVNIPSASFCDASVEADNFGGMEKAVRLLKSLGHRSIAFAVDYIPTNMVYSTSQRMEAFLEAAEQNGYDEDHIDIVSAEPHERPLPLSELASQLVAQLLSSQRHPTAVCAETDAVAIALVKELRRQHLRVPEDVSVIGFDDANIAVDADLTTIHQDPVELGRMAAAKVLQLLGKPIPTDVHVGALHESLEPTIVLRETTGRSDS